MPKPFPVALTADFYANGQPKYRDMGLSVFEGQSHIKHRPFAEHKPEIGPEQIGDARGVVVLTPKVTRKSLSSASNLLAMGRFGCGDRCHAASVVRGRRECQ